MTAAKMIAAARATLGMGEPNNIQSWYAARNGAAYRYNFPWCQAAVCKWSTTAGAYQAVMFGVDDAYTVTAARRFQQHGQWIPGTAANVRKAKPGDIVYFDWDGTNTLSKVDHVGIVERVLPDGRLQTIEGNTDNACKRRVRSHGVIAGLGRPDYTRKATTPAKPPAKNSGSGGGLVVDGRLGPLTLRATQRALGVNDDGVWGPVTVRAMQRRCGAGVDGRLGPQTKRQVQRRVGATVDGIWPGVLGYTPAGIVRTSADPVSETTRQLQRALNAGRF